MTKYRYISRFGLCWVSVALLSLLNSSCSLNPSNINANSSKNPENSKLSSKNLPEKTALRGKLKLDHVKLENLGHLIRRSQEATQSEKKDAQWYHKVGLEAANAKEWGGAAKAHGEEAIRLPTPENLMLLAKALVMTDGTQPSESETLKVKLQNFQRAIKYYRLATKLSEATGKTLSQGQKQEIREATICLNAFIKKPDPKNPSCQLVKDALEVNQIN